MCKANLLGTLLCIYLVSGMGERWRLEESVENWLMGSRGAEGWHKEDLLLEGGLGLIWSHLPQQDNNQKMPTVNYWHYALGILN